MCSKRGNYHELKKEKKKKKKKKKKGTLPVLLVPGQLLCIVDFSAAESTCDV